MVRIEIDFYFIYNKTYGFPPGGIPIGGALRESLNLYESEAPWPLVGVGGWFDPGGGGPGGYPIP